MALAPPLCPCPANIVTPTTVTSTNSPSVTPPNTSVTPGAPVLAQFTDQAWYRAVVQEPVGAGAKVLFIYLISELFLQWKNMKMYSLFLYTGSYA